MTIVLRYGLIQAIGVIAQLVEQRIENPCVPSSILGLATIFEKAPYIMYGAFHACLFNKNIKTLPVYKSHFIHKQRGLSPILP